MFSFRRRGCRFTISTSAASTTPPPPSSRSVILFANWFYRLQRIACFVQHFIHQVVICFTDGIVDQAIKRANCRDGSPPASRSLGSTRAAFLRWRLVRLELVAQVARGLGSLKPRSPFIVFQFASTTSSTSSTNLVALFGHIVGSATHRLGSWFTYGGIFLGRRRATSSFRPGTPVASSLVSASFFSSRRPSTRFLPSNITTSRLVASRFASSGFV